jgi:hypothetical protein
VTTLGLCRRAVARWSFNICRGEAGRPFNV